MIARLRALIRTIRGYFCIDTIGGHREYTGSSGGCPGNQLMPVVETLRGDLRMSAP